jgi:hypothetical protein
MPVRVLYRKIPPSKRICIYYRCQKPVLRNYNREYLLKTNNFIHNGCKNAAEDEKLKCLNCLCHFNALEASFDTQQICRGDEVSEKLVILCPYCGSRNVKHLSGGPADV